VAVSDEIKSRLAALCCSRRTRNRDFLPSRPCDWRSTGMTDPRSGEVFTEDGAWKYVAEMIERGVQIEIIELDQPPGKTGYTMLLPSHDPKSPIYVKLQLGSGVVIGRSFHYSEKQADAETDKENGDAK